MSFSFSAGAWPIRGEDSILEPPVTGGCGVTRSALPSREALEDEAGEGDELEEDRSEDDGAEKCDTDDAEVADEDAPASWLLTLLELEGAGLLGDGLLAGAAGAGLLIST